MEKPNNPPAFPSKNSPGEILEKGMTLRDYFAEGAMRALVNKYGVEGGNAQINARKSYAQADAMLAEREK